MLYLTNGLAIAACLLVVAGSAYCENAEGWRNSLHPEGTPGDEITLASAGKTDYVIMIPTKPTTQERKAADDLKLWLDKMTGASFPISADVAANPKIISVGQTTEAARADLPDIDLGRDGYAIFQRGDVLFLLGGSRRGPINAVYALLEEDLGCRWYDRETSEIPRMPTLRFRPVERSYVPVLDIRDPFYWEAFDADWSVRNRTIAPWVKVPEEWGGTTNYALWGHAFDWLVPPDEYFDKHPEYFSERDGKRTKAQLCMSNPDVLSISIEKVKTLLRSRPKSELVSISVNDCRGYCECAKCDPINKAEGTYAAPLVLFCNAIADAIKDEFPDVKVSTLAYMDATEAPKTIKPRDNVVIQLCTDRHAWSNPFRNLLETERFQKALKGWHKLGANITIWDYTANYHHYPIVMPNWQVVDDNIRILIEHGAKGIMLQGAYQSPGGDNSAMRSWVWAKKLWDPSLDSKELMRDFVFGYYREAAAPMWEYTTMLWDMWQENHSKPKGQNLMLCGIRYYPDSLFLDSGHFLTKARILMRRAETLATSPETSRRLAAARFPVLYLAVSQEIGFVDYYKVFQPRIKQPEPNPNAESSERQDLSEQMALLDRFEAIGKMLGVTHIREGKPDFDAKIKQLRTALACDLSDSVVRVLPDGWKTKADPGDVGVKDSWFAQDFDESAWTPPRTAPSDGIVWYRQQIDVPADLDKYKHAYLWFDAVGDEAWIYVNGKQAFEHTNKSTALPMLDLRQRPFFFDAKEHLHAGSNLVAVRASSNGSPSGVHKPVTLILTDLDDLPRRP
jgi:hypothetical protein